MSVCPVCHEQIETLEFMNHVMERHPYFFVVWASMNMPWFHSEAILDSPDDVDDMSYEFLSELCDRIGYHRLGITNFDDITTPIVSDDKLEPCPICFDTMEVATKINVCSHAFCYDCIYKWLSDHKTCPICVRDVSGHQIADTSISSPATSPSSINTT